MSETNTTCPICDRTVDFDQPDAVLAEKVDDHAGFGAHDWPGRPLATHTRECLAGANGFRAAAPGSVLPTHRPGANPDPAPTQHHRLLSGPDDTPDPFARRGIMTTAPAVLALASAAPSRV